MSLKVVRDTEMGLVVGSDRTTDTPDRECGQCMHRRWIERDGHFQCDVTGEGLEWKNNAPDVIDLADDDAPFHNYEHPDDDPENPILRGDNCHELAAKYEEVVRGKSAVDHVSTPNPKEIHLVVSTDMYGKSKYCGGCRHRRADEDGQSCDIFGDDLPEGADTERLKDCLQAERVYLALAGQSAPESTTSDRVELPTAKNPILMSTATEVPAVQPQPASFRQDGLVRLVVTLDIDADTEDCDGCDYLDADYLDADGDRCLIFNEDVEYNDADSTWARLDACKKGARSAAQELRSTEGLSEIKQHIDQAAERLKENQLTATQKDSLAMVLRVIGNLDLSEWSEYAQKRAAEGIALIEKLSTP